MLVPNRNYQSPAYRYGFQGQEKDDEIKGFGNSLNYKFRIHDPRVGRFFAVDPLTAKYPHYTPYSFSGNKVIDHVELEGQEEIKAYLLNKKLFSYFQFDFSTQQGVSITQTKTSDVSFKIDNNVSNGEIFGPLNKISFIKAPKVTQNDVLKLDKDFKKGTVVPGILLKKFKGLIDEKISLGMQELNSTLNKYDELSEYTDLAVVSTRNSINKIITDIETGRAKLIYRKAEDKFKNIINENGKNENIKYSEGHIFNVIYDGTGHGALGRLNLQFTIYEKEQDYHDIEEQNNKSSKENNLKKESKNDLNSNG